MSSHTREIWRSLYGLVLAIAQAEELADARSAAKGCWETALSAMSFEVELASTRGEKLHVRIGKREAYPLAKGDRVVVLDTSDMSRMGDFEIVDVRSDHYVAVGVEGSLDPLWHGYVKERGEVNLLAEMIAVHLIEEAIDGK